MEAICRCCNLLKSDSHFTHRTIKKNGSEYSYYMKDCKSCRSESQKKKYQSLNNIERLNFNKKRYANNSDSVKERSKKYYQYNKDKDNFKDRRKEYYNNNREEIIKKSYSYKKDRMEYDVLYKFKNSVRCRVLSALKGYKKDSNTESIIGCSFDCLINHIESKFVENMTWENRDKWEVDHIVPLSLAVNQEEIIFLSNYKNLQPLWIEDNRAKYNYYDETNEIYQELIKLRTANDK